MKKHFLHKRIFYPIRIYREQPPFIYNHNRDYDYNYYRCFCIDYKMFETDTFSNRNGWFLRFKPFAIPKIRNNILKFIFGQRKYYICTEWDKEFTTSSEDLTRKEVMDRFLFEGDEGIKRTVHFSHIEYNGFLFGNKKEKKMIKEFQETFLNIIS